MTALPPVVTTTTSSAAIDAATVTVMEDGIDEVVSTLGRRGYCKTELWVHFVALILAVAIARIGVSSNTAVQLAAIIAPVFVSTTFNILRVQEKRALAEAVTWVHHHISHA